MICKNAVVVFDPSEILPSYGENRISASYDGRKLLLSVFFDGADGESNISFVFENTCFYKMGSIPGVDDTTIRYEKYNSISSLVEFEYSDFKNKWEENFNHLFKLRHLKIFFLNENKFLEVICESFSLDNSN
jgi:hypothetical protein